MIENNDENLQEVIDSLVRQIELHLSTINNLNDFIFTLKSKIGYLNNVLVTNSEWYLEKLKTIENFLQENGIKLEELEEFENKKIIEQNIKNERNKN